MHSDMMRLPVRLSRLTLSAVALAIATQFRIARRLRGKGA